MLMLRLSALASAFFCAMADSAMFAQTPSAIIVGIVQDQSGVAMPGAVVEIQNIDTNDKRAAPSDAQGECTIPNLTPGKYEVTVTRQGFRILKQTGIELELDQTARFEFKMQVGAIAESISVIASAPLLNTENAVKGEVMVSRE